MCQNEIRKILGKALQGMFLSFFFSTSLNKLIIVLLMIVISELAFLNLQLDVYLKEGTHTTAAAGKLL